MRAFASVALAACTTVCSCASLGAPRPRPVTPAEIADLQLRALRDSADIDPQLRLATAYRSQARLRDALPVAEKALARWPEHSRAALLVGLTREDLGDYGAAREAYERALRTTGSPRLRSELKSRLVLLQRREMQAHVRDALAREAELASTPPRPHTVAVFPLASPPTDSLLGPLGRALTAMLITDLAQTSRLTVLDRTLVQTLVDEIRLGELGYVDERTAARGGRLLGAERIVQGSLASNEALLRLEAAVVSLAPAGQTRARPPAARPPAEKAAPAAQQATRLSEAAGLDALFDMEKRLALKIYAAAGIELTPAERATVTARRTENLQAVLAYGRGLLASDAGDLETALRFFSQSAHLDPAFAAVRVQVAATRAIAAAGRVSTQQLAATAEQAAATASAAAAAALPLLPLDRDALAELLGTEGVTARTMMELVIQRPGGSQ